jgi:hypothetical protein
LRDLGDEDLALIDVPPEDAVKMSPAVDEDTADALVRALAIHRSQIAFARGVWTGMAMMSMSVFRV